MNRENAKDYLPLVQALAEGKVIQFKCAGGWEEIERPMFSGDPTEWRIKPAPVGPDEMWFVYGDKGQVVATCSTLSQTSAHLLEGRTVVRYRRVEE